MNIINTGHGIEDNNYLFPPPPPLFCLEDDLSIFRRLVYSL